MQFLWFKVFNHRAIVARPPFPCRYLPVSDTPFTIYYAYDLERNEATVISLEFTAGDPAKRFTRFY